ncbi:MAG TPA: hypothetical protein VLC91_10910 [Spongiibacteraceae bacterium]|nr:hypothetical protein [Spongiibacteraceae bacterium]
MKKPADSLSDAIAAELDTLLQQLAAGFDVTPAQRLHLEGLTAACLLTGGDAQILLELCRQRLPAGANVKLSADGCTLQFDLWQQRAPVYPTTTD